MGNDDFVNLGTKDGQVTVDVFAIEELTSALKVADAARCMFCRECERTAAVIVSRCGLERRRSGGRGWRVGAQGAGANWSETGRVSLHSRDSGLTAARPGCDSSIARVEGKAQDLLDRGRESRPSLTVIERLKHQHNQLIDIGLGACSFFP